MFSKTPLLFPSSKKPFTFLSRTKAMVSWNEVVRKELKDKGKRHITELSGNRPKQLFLLENVYNTLIDSLSDDAVKAIARLDLSTMTAPSLSKLPYSTFERKLTDEQKNQIKAKQRGMKEEEKAKLLGEEKLIIRERVKDIIFAGIAIYVYMDIYNEYYIRDPNNSVIYAGLPAVLGVTKDNVLDYKSARKALMYLKNFIVYSNEILLPTEAEIERTQSALPTTYNRVLDLTRVDSNINPCLIPTTSQICSQITTFCDHMEEFMRFDKSKLQHVEPPVKPLEWENKPGWMSKPTRAPLLKEIQSVNPRTLLHHVNPSLIKNAQFDLKKLEITRKPSTKQTKPHLFSTYEFSDANARSVVSGDIDLQSIRPKLPTRFFDSFAWKLCKTEPQVSLLEKRRRLLKKKEDVLAAVRRLRGE